MRIEWTPSLSVGIEDIDRQQRELYALADRIVSAPGACDRELETLVRRLLETARAQFAAEERVLEGAREPALVRHAHEHRRFLSDLAIVADQLAAGNRPAVDRLDLGRFVGAWIATHVTRSDRDLVRAAARPKGAPSKTSPPSA